MKRPGIMKLAVLVMCLQCGRAAQGQDASAQSEPPRAEPIEKKLELFGQVRIDPYYWLNDRANPKVKAYLTAENAYTDAMMAHTKAFQNALYDEIVGRIKQADSTAPVFDNGYYYFTRFETGKQYPILVRKKGTLAAAEEVFLTRTCSRPGAAIFRWAAGK